MTERDIAETLSDLERQVFEVVRANTRSSVNDVAQELDGQSRPLAYTTVMTVLTRLWEKGFLFRQRQGKAYVYMAREQAEIAGEMGKRAARETLEKYGDLALTGFVENLTPQQRALVGRLLGNPVAPDGEARP